ncbi:MAG: ester cyclase [Thermoplasmata archaeon]
MVQPELKEFGRKYAEAWSSQDPASVAAFFSETVSLSVNDADPNVGREAIAGVARGFMSDFPDLVVTMDVLVPQSRGIAFHWAWRGTNTGPGGVVSGSGSAGMKFGRLVLTGS